MNSKFVNAEYELNFVEDEGIHGDIVYEYVLLIFEKNIMENFCSISSSIVLPFLFVMVNEWMSILVL